METKTPLTDAVTNWDTESTLVAQLCRDLETKYKAAEQARKEAEELHDMQMAAISTAAFANTEESKAQARVGRDNPYWSQPLQDVYYAIDREIRERNRANQATRELECITADRDAKSTRMWELGKQLDEATREMAGLRQALQVAKESLYNPFEPDNQSRAYQKVASALALPMGDAADGQDGWRVCGFCRCRTNARLRRCCHKGHDADVAQQVKQAGEPVAWRWKWHIDSAPEEWAYGEAKPSSDVYSREPLYAHPAQQTND